jgi:hypothetical protein
MIFFHPRYKHLKRTLLTMKLLSSCDTGKKFLDESYYKQAVINPPVADYGYATALTYPEFCQLPRVQRLTNNEALQTDLKAAFGAQEVVLAQYEGDWLRVFREYLGLTDATGLTELELNHISVSDDLTELVRQVNAMHLPQQERNAFLANVQACFQTSHNMLRYSYKFTPEVGDRSQKEIVGRLGAKTEIQAEMIHRLSEWLDQVRPSAVADDDTRHDDRPRAGDHMAP